MSGYDEDYDKGGHLSGGPEKMARIKEYQWVVMNTEEATPLEDRLGYDLEIGLDST